MSVKTQLKRTFKSKSLIITIGIGVALIFAVIYSYSAYKQNEYVQKGIEKIKYNENLHHDKVPYYVDEIKPYGLSLGEWSARWWQWVQAIPEDVNPAGPNPVESAEAIENQPNNEIFFLTGGYDVAVNRSVTIPSDKPIMFPLYNTEYSLAKEAAYPADDEGLINNLKGLTVMETERAEHMVAKLDDKDISYYRVQSPIYVQPYPKHNLFDYRITGLTNLYSYADGYYAYLPPLSVGHHRLFLLADGRDYTSGVDYNITVVAKPSPKIDHRSLAISDLSKGISMINIGNVSQADYYLQKAHQETAMLLQSQPDSVKAEKRAAESLQSLRDLVPSVAARYAQDSIDYLNGKPVDESAIFKGGES